MFNKTLLADIKTIHKYIALIVVIIIAAVGAYALVGSHAATPYASVTASNGTVGGGAQSVQSCNGASSGGCVQFGTGLLWTGDFSTLSGWDDQSCPGGVSIVSSPARLPGSYSAEFTVNDNSTEANCPLVPTDNPRAQLVGPSLFSSGDDRYIAFSTFFPADFPTISPPDWLQVAEIYGPPYGGSPSIGIDVYGNSLMLYTGAAGYGTIWTSSSDIPKGTAWEDIVLHVKFSTDPTVGFVELWLNGVQQTFTNGSQRFYYDTITPGLNDGAPNALFLNQYRDAAVSLGTVTLYHAEARVGTTYASVALPLQ